MAFTIQDDNGTTPGANAYIAVTTFREHHEDRGNDVDCFSEKQIERAIVRATDYLDQRFNFIGLKQIREQRTQWPRCDAYDSDDNAVHGIPFEVKMATAEYALIALNGEINPTPTREDNGRVVSRKFEKVGPLEEETVYERGVRFEMPRYPRADNIIKRRGLIRSAGRIRRG